MRTTLLQGYIRQKHLKRLTISAPKYFFYPANKEWTKEFTMRDVFKKADDVKKVVKSHQVTHLSARSHPSSVMLPTKSVAEAVG